MADRVVLTEIYMDHFFDRQFVLTPSHQAGKPGKVREFDSTQGKVREICFFGLWCEVAIHYIIDF